MKFATLSVFVMACVLSDHKTWCCKQQQATTSAVTTSTATTSTATTSTVPITTTNPATEGIFIAGGDSDDASRSTELFIPHTGKSCSLPDLPDSREDHTMDTLGNTPVLCGGYGYATSTSCLHFTPTSASGVWTNYATILKGRFGHTSWVSSAGLVLIGGWSAGTITEILPSGGGNFSLVQYTRYACAIADKDSTIITGGGGQYIMKEVARYNLQGHVENLPEMIQGRMFHGCGSYYSGGTMVLVLAGGQDYDGNPLSSTEQLTMGGTAWTTAKSLPRTLYGVASVSMNNQIYILGGTGADYNEMAEIMAFDGEDWKEVGELQKARSGHAATNIVTTDINCE